MNLFWKPEVLPCPRDDAGWFEYSAETQRLLDENEPLVRSWRAVLPWNLFKSGRQLKVIGARIDAQTEAMREME